MAFPFVCSKVQLQQLLPPYLTSLFAQLVFPGWKQSSIVPIPKASEHNSPSNYRPISLLSTASKIIERHVHYNITAHLEDTHPISNLQWGFQQGKSTVTSLLSVVHEWLKILESGKEVYSVFFDLKKAFDTVPHRKPMTKLQTLGL